MSPEAQRIAIAEACGWKRGKYGFIKPGTRKFELPTAFLPAYLHDLNAMHEAEKVLTDEQLLRRHGHLLNKCGRSLNASRATATQRAEVFLRAIGKWEDAK